MFGADQTGQPVRQLNVSHEPSPRSTLLSLPGVAADRQERAARIVHRPLPRPAAWPAALGPTCWSSQSCSGAAACRKSETRDLAAAVPSHAATGQSCHAMSPLWRSRPIRGWSGGYPLGALLRFCVPATWIHRLRGPPGECHASSLDEGASRRSAAGRAPWVSQPGGPGRCGRSPWLAVPRRLPARCRTARTSGRRSRRR